jgi:hypothetical protein
LSNTLTIPAEVIPDVREGLFCVLGGAAESTLHTLEQPDREYHPEWFREDREQLKEVLALLDLVGWNAGCETGQMDVDVAAHSHTLKAAVDAYLPILENQEKEADVDDERRAQEGRPPRKREIVRRVVALRDLATRLAVVKELP